MKKIGFLLLFISIILMIVGFSEITGAVMGSGIDVVSLLRLFGIVLFIGASILILAEKESLEAIVIPTGNETEERKRAEKAAREYNRKHPKKVIISGINARDIKEDPGHRQVYDILKEKTNPKINDEDIETDYSSNTLENVLSLKEIKGTVEIVSTKDHLKRIKKWVDYLKHPEKKDEEYKLPDDLTIRYIDAGKETFLDRFREYVSSFTLNRNISKGVKDSLKRKKRNVLAPVKKLFDKISNYLGNKE